MADQIPFEYQTQFGDVAEKEKIAQLMAALRGEQQKQLQGQMVSGHYVPPSPMQGLASMFSAWQQGKATRDADKLRKGILTKMSGDEEAERQRIASMLMGSLEQIGPPDPQGGMGLQGNMPNPAAASQAALASKFPNMQKFGQQLRQQASSNFSAMAPRATPESLNVAQAQGGNPMALTAQPQETYSDIRNLAPEGQDPLMGAVSKTTNKPIFAPKATSQTVSVGDKANSQILAQAAKDFREPAFRDRVQGLRTTLEAGTFAWRLLDEGNLNLGLDTDIKTFAQKLGGILGLPVDSKAGATELYNSFIVPQVGRIVKLFGAGTGLSDADREFATKAVAMAKNDPRMINVALAFALRGASKEMQALEAERVGYVGMAQEAGVHPSAFGPPLNWSFQVPKNASKTFPENPYEPGALETWGMERLFGAPPEPPPAPGAVLGSPEDVARRYLPGAR